MADLFDYLDWRGDLSFEQVPLTPVDALIFSALSYVHYDGLVRDGFQHPVPLWVVAEAFAALPDQDERVLLKNDGKLLKAAGKTRRFADVKLVFYRNETVLEQESQFSAVAFLLPDEKTAVLAFRGTDSTLVGWKEDFNMSFQPFVPAQDKALYYTQTFAKVFQREMILCGHSKGGNLAVCAASRCPHEIQERISAVYNNDGPGFTAALLADPGYRELVPKIHSFVPQSAVIGMLLEHQEPYTVVKSRQVSILQHDLYTWEILGPGFVLVNEVNDDARLVNRTVRTWLESKTLEERNRFVDAVFDLLGTGDVDNAREIMLPWNLLNYVKTLNEDEQMRNLIGKELGDLFRTATALRKQKDLPALSE